MVEDLNSKSMSSMTSFSIAAGSSLFLDETNSCLLSLPVEQGHNVEQVLQVLPCGHQGRTAIL